MLNPYQGMDEPNQPARPQDSLWQLINNPMWYNYQRQEEERKAQEFYQQYGRYPIGGGGAAGAGAAAAGGPAAGGAGAAGAAGAAIPGAAGPMIGTASSGAASAGVPASLAAAGGGGGWAGALEKLGGVFGGMASSAAAGKQNQGNMAIAEFQALLSAALAKQAAETNKARDIRTAPQDRLKQQLTANLIQGWKPTTISHPRATIPQIGGGAPAFNATTQEHAGLMSADALARQRQGQSAPDITPSMQMPPSPTMPTNSWWDKLLGYGGAAATIGSQFVRR